MAKSYRNATEALGLRGRKQVGALVKLATDLTLLGAAEPAEAMLSKMLKEYQKRRAEELRGRSGVGFAIGGGAAIAVARVDRCRCGHGARCSAP